MAYFFWTHLCLSILLIIACKTSPRDPFEFDVEQKPTSEEKQNTIIDQSRWTIKKNEHGGFILEHSENGELRKIEVAL